jgi:UDP-glucose 4-epimerase
MTQGNILITGGAGYIGSHAVLAFQDAGFAVAVIDNLSTGLRSAVPDGVEFVEGDAGDQTLVGGVIRQHNISAVIHFAGSIVVPESVANPLKYYQNNTGVSRNLIAACVEYGVENFIFSSTAAVYGIPDEVPVSETSPTQPINPYGNSKLMTEWVLRDTSAAHDFNYVALRYFNVAGADPDGRSGQSTKNATHLLKVACQTALGERPQLDIFGTDYETRDGTCIRDYIHVTDLADAHLKAFNFLTKKRESLVLNCGYGHGTSVKEAIAAVKRVSKVDFAVGVEPRRAGDPPSLVAENRRIRQMLDWQPRYDDVEFIVRTALDWERRLTME